MPRTQSLKKHDRKVFLANLTGENITRNISIELERRGLADEIDPWKARDHQTLRYVREFNKDQEKAGNTLLELVNLKEIQNDGMMQQFFIPLQECSLEQFTKVLNTIHAAEIAPGLKKIDRYVSAVVSSGKSTRNEIQLALRFLLPEPKAIKTSKAKPKTKAKPQKVATASRRDPQLN